MAQRLPAVLLILALAAAPAYAQTTDVGECAPDRLHGVPPGASLEFASLECRLGALEDALHESDDSLGRLYGPIQFRLEKSAGRLVHAAALCDGRLDTDEHRAGKQLRRCGRLIAAAVAKIRSNHGRRTIPPEVAAALASEADGLTSDLELTRQSLTCPPPSTTP